MTPLFTPTGEYPRFLFGVWLVEFRADEKIHRWFAFKRDGSAIISTTYASDLTDLLRFED